MHLVLGAPPGRCLQPSHRHTSSRETDEHRTCAVHRLILRKHTPRKARTPTQIGAITVSCAPIEFTDCASPRRWHRRRASSGWFQCQRCPQCPFNYSHGKSCGDSHVSASCRDAFVPDPRPMLRAQQRTSSTAASASALSLRGRSHAERSIFRCFSLAMRTDEGAVAQQRFEPRPSASRCNAGPHIPPRLNAFWLVAPWELIRIRSQPVAGRGARVSPTSGGNLRHPASTWLLSTTGRELARVGTAALGTRWAL